MPDPPLIGLFVGGASRRMGGSPKGLLQLPDGRSLIERLLSEVKKAAPGAPLFLVGRAEAYAHLRLSALSDSPTGIGPLGGLRALLLLAQAESRPNVLALACDLPFVSANLLKRLLLENPNAAALAPRVDGFWSAFTARYSVLALPSVDAALGAGEYGLQRLFERLGADATPLPVDSDERLELRDWDTPEDRNSRPST